MDVKNIVDNFRNKMNDYMSFAAQIYLSIAALIVIIIIIFIFLINKIV